MRRAKARGAQASGPLHGYTLDTGALIALERRRVGVITRVREAAAAQQPIHIPAAVVAEFWRGKGPKDRELRTLIQTSVEDDTLARATLAGTALGKVGKLPRGRGPGPVDALVAVLAAEMGDAIITGDPDDMKMLREHLVGIFDIIAV